MCGRYSLGLDRDDIARLSGYHVGEWVNQDAFIPRHNIAPRSQAPVMRRRNLNLENGENPETILHTMKWGLVPHWSRHEDTSINTINARSESLVEGTGMWNSIRGRKRCAVVCQGYFEWLKKGKTRIPYFTKLKDGSIMLLAGLYDSAVLEGDSEALWSFTIVTTSSNKDFAWLHDRQPVILSTRAALNTWLDTSSEKWSSELTKLVAPYDNSKAPLECYEVPREVGRVGTESSTYIEPITKRKDGIQALFSKQMQKHQASNSVSPRSIKRKRNTDLDDPPTSTVIDLTVDSDDSSSAKSVPQHPNKKPKRENPS